MKPSAKIGYRLGLGLAAVTLILFFLPSLDNWHTLGPANTGHEPLACQECHTVAEGTARQQVQANLRYWLGTRASPVAFQHNDVGNEDCLACHERESNNHPVFRFNEPRFAEARANIQPQLCVSCHMEHEGVRVTMETTFCVECHQDLTLRNDPIDVQHEQLVAQEDWESCLTCHDFHGNHVMELETAVGDGLTQQEIEAYFNGGDSPYSDEKIFEAKDSR
jgi:hypothetical protein